MDSQAIETARLDLQPMQFADANAIHQISNQPGVRKYLFDDKPVSLAFVRETLQQSVCNFESRKFGIWTITEKRAPEVIGFCGLRSADDLAEIEILYALSESKWHCGYAIEAASAVQGYAFDRCGLNRLIGITDAANVESWRVLERLGMREYRPSSATNIYATLSSRAGPPPYLRAEVD
jgi:RimJ/RimL family protein N-acetyltransferase